MFTGIVEATGKIKNIVTDQSNRLFYIETPLASQLKIDESVNHNGICLTIEEANTNVYRVTAIAETLKKTNAASWKAGDLINLERSLPVNGRFDGHIVQGHVDGTATCTQKKDKEGSKEFTFRFDEKFSHLIIEKGSVCVNGVSLTAFNITRDHFTVAIIPYTFTHTNFKTLCEGNTVNIEYDMIGKYIGRITEVYQKK